MEDNWPKIEIKAHGKVNGTVLSDQFYWTIKTYIAGPDDVIQTDSKPFSTRQAATESLLDKFESVVKQQLTDLLA